MAVIMGDVVVGWYKISTTTIHSSGMISISICWVINPEIICPYKNATLVKYRGFHFKYINDQPLLFSPLTYVFLAQFSSLVCSL
jgi:hypothetical protein